MKTRNKKNIIKGTNKIEIENSIFKRIFIDFKYSHFIFPFLYFFIMGFVAMTNRPIGDYGLETDFYWSYAPQAKEFLKGNLVIDQFRGPLYQIVLGIFGFIFGNDFFPAGKFLNVLFASITLYFISRIISSIYDMRAAVLVVMLVMVNTVFIKCSYEPGTDMLFLVFYTSALFFILKDKELNNKNFFIAGILSGMAYLTRYTAISLMISVIIIFVINIYKNYKQRENKSLVNILKPIVYYLTPVLTSVAVWSVICFYKTGSFFYNMNYRNTAYAVYKPEKLPPDEWTLKYEDSFTSFNDVVFRDFGTFLYKIFIINFTSYFIKDLSALLPIYLGVIAAAGLLFFLLKFKSHNLLQKYFFLINVLFYIQILFAFYSERFSLPILPLYCFLIIKFFDYNFIQGFNFNLGKIKLYTIIILTLISVSFMNSYNFVKERINLVPLEILSISKSMKLNYKEDISGKTIMARKPQIAFYLDMNFEVIPYSKNYEEFYENIKRKNADYVYISEWECRILTPELAKVLIDYRNPQKELEVVTYIPKPVAIIYKVK